MDMSIAEIIKLVLPLAAVELILKIVAITALIKDEKVKAMPKWGWALVIVFVNLFGSLAFLIFGRVKD